MKFIRVKRLENKRDAFILFPDNVTHLGMSRLLGYDHVGIISAGFVRLTPDGPECYGESIGLSKKSIQNDSGYMKSDTYKLHEQWLEEAF